MRNRLAYEHRVDAFVKRFEAGLAQEKAMDDPNVPRRALRPQTTAQPEASEQIKPYPPTTPKPNEREQLIEFTKNMFATWQSKAPEELNESDIGMLRGLDVLFSEPLDQIVNDTMRMELEADMAQAARNGWRIPKE